MFKIDIFLIFFSYFNLFTGYFYSFFDARTKAIGVYILLQMFKYLAVITTAASLQPIRKQYFQNFRNSHKEKEE